jgi:hypothetical protein
MKYIGGAGMNIELLLKDISAISKKYDLINQKTGGYFNIFDIANIASDEVTICRTIYELINPKGTHCQGNLYLKLFVKHVLGMEFTDLDYKTIKVSREYVMSDDRRIDLLLETQEKSIPIEVKVYAGDQSKQCYDYYSKKAHNSNLFYLTLSGHVPSSASAAGLNPIYGDKNEIIGYKEVTQISFDNEMLNWLNYCLEQQATIKISPIREIIMQFIAVIRRLTNHMEEGKEMEIIETLLSSSDNLKSALDIENALPMIKTKVMMDLFEELNCQFISKGKKIINFNKEDIKAYYKPNVRTYPSINIKIKELKPNLIATLCIEVSVYLYYYFSFMELDKTDGVYKLREVADIKASYKNEYEKFINGVKEALPFQGKKTKYTFFWDYIYDNNNQEYNFKKFSDTCVALSQDTKNSAISICNFLNQYVDDIAMKL